VWLAQEPTGMLRAQAEAAAAKLGLPLEIRETGDTGLERALERLLSVPGTSVPGTSSCRAGASENVSGTEVPDTFMGGSAC
jgi:hypothetical protein